ncbi:MAG: Gfo/Idh/MocA family oxidoreductase [Propionibacteriaceae bacterium]|nr:Gfo/Idh/MocA family oxidoreductase [Propionibacteriaceae bacterium]
MLKVGIIGTGNISPAHIKGYLEFPQRCEIVALCDVVPERAEEKKERFGLTGATVYSDHRAMLEAVPDLDLVSIATPPFCHAEITIDCLHAGVNVLVEKPMAPSLEECDAMLEAQWKSGKVLSVVAQNRFRDDMIILKDALDSGLAGPIAHLKVDSAWWRGKPYYDLWWRGTWKSEGGGPTLNHAIHHLDLTLWLMGQPEAVTAVLTNAWHDNSEVEDLSVAILSYDHALAEITSSVVHHGEEQAIVAQGRDARISQPWKVVASVSQPNGFPHPDGNPELTAQLEAIATAHEPLAHPGHTGQIDDVLSAIEEGRPPAIDGEAGRATVELVTAIYEAGIEHRTVTLPLAADDPYFTSAGLLERAPHFFEKTASVEDLGGFITVPGSPDPAQQ